MTLPNSFIVGVNKAGTTAVFNALTQHPHVCGSTTKETHFFDPLKYGQAPGPLTDYSRYFRPTSSQHCVLEATPGYFYGGAAIASRLRTFGKGTKAIVILREPGSRAFSWFRFCRTRLLLPQSLGFSDYLRECATLGITPEGDPNATGWRGLSGGLYAEWIDHWSGAFANDLLVILYEDLQTNFSEVMGRIGSHLNLHSFSYSRQADNVSTDISSKGLQRFALSANRHGEGIWRGYPGVKRVLRTAYYRMNARASQGRMLDAEREWLDDYFSAPNERLRNKLPHLTINWRTQ
jgi:hypothetical protein